MSRPTVQHFDIRTAEHGTALALILYGLLSGASTILGGAARWAAPAYEVAMLVPGAPESWGWALLALSLVTALGYANSDQRRGLNAVCVGFFLMGTWCLFFGISFLIQFIDNNTVSASGALVNFVFAFLYTQRSVMYWRGVDAIQ